MKTMTKENIALDADKWDVYTIIDFTVAFVLVIVSMVSAEIPRQKIEIVRQSAPYTARGWKPAGEQFNLPLRAQPPVPAASYGPPPEATTEQATTTEATTEDFASQQAENVVEPQNAEQKSNKVEEDPMGQYYVVLPQGQNLVYIPRSAAVVAAVPRARLMAVPARLRAVPVSSAMPSSAYSPYGAPLIQIYQ